MKCRGQTNTGTVCLCSWVRTISDLIFFLCLERRRVLALVEVSVCRHDFVVIWTTMAGVLVLDGLNGRRRLWFLVDPVRCHHTLALDFDLSTGDNRNVWCLSRQQLRRRCRTVDSSFDWITFHSRCRIDRVAVERENVVSVSHVRKGIMLPWQQSNQNPADTGTYPNNPKRGFKEPITLLTTGPEWKPARTCKVPRE